TSVTLYRPWLDEPPLFSLIVGFFAHINGAVRTDFIPSSYIRIPSILFAAATSIFIFLIARLVSNYWGGILAMLMYGTVPIMVIASRVALPGNL
ncbi:MAG: glycosyltransferase family 39 protein, partial [Actinobacteria bacterium]|nr:glycosyltransferase family 39 protein [Actinomycetota bacterium]